MEKNYMIQIISSIILLLIYGILCSFVFVYTFMYFPNELLSFKIITLIGIWFLFIFTIILIIELLRVK